MNSSQVVKENPAKGWMATVSGRFLRFSGLTHNGENSRQQ